MLEVAQHISIIGANDEAVVGKGDDATPLKAPSVAQDGKTINGALGIDFRADL